MMNTYEKDGYLVVRQAIPPADLEPFRACISRQIGVHAQKLFDEGKIDRLYEDLPFGQRLAALHVNNELRLRSWDAPVFCTKHSESLKALAPDAFALTPLWSRLAHNVPGTQRV